jgi:hypothetical protein
LEEEEREGRKVMKNKGEKNPKLEVKISYIEYHFFYKLHLKIKIFLGSILTC